MKRLNKKGFTLVELLVVLVILVVIMSIAIPSITSSLERSKEKQKDATIKLIVSAGELYADRHKNTFDGIVTVAELIDNGFLTREEARDPFNDSSTLCGYVNYEDSDYKFVEDDSECVSIE
ncbi:MAG: prepilin-type N-terminal cleavage/methylation domain-containing protein [Bacilli bacterium]|nr:prepilin-type N-terminal cleavage/methylation domain-containing protein [Bacilli bacterium]